MHLIAVFVCGKPKEILLSRGTSALSWLLTLNSWLLTDLKYTVVNLTGDEEYTWKAVFFIPAFQKRVNSFSFYILDPPAGLEWVRV